MFSSVIPIRILRYSRRYSNVCLVHIYTEQIFVIHISIHFYFRHDFLRIRTGLVDGYCVPYTPGYIQQLGFRLRYQLRKLNCNFLVFSQLERNISICLSWKELFRFQIKDKIFFSVYSLKNAIFTQNRKKTKILHENTRICTDTFYRIDKISNNDLCILDKFQFRNQQIKKVLIKR